MLDQPGPTACLGSAKMNSCPVAPSQILTFSWTPLSIDYKPCCTPGLEWCWWGHHTENTRLAIIGSASKAKGLEITHLYKLLPGQDRVGNNLHVSEFQNGKSQESVNLMQEELPDREKTPCCFNCEQQTLNLSFSNPFDGTRVVKSRKNNEILFQGATGV